MKTDAATESSVEHHFFQANGLRLHCAVQGEGPVIMFLHGFPEFWLAWRKQIPHFSASHRVVVPDLRGYNLSDKPTTVEAYQMKHIVSDIAALIPQLSADPVVLVGHDWGGAVAWMAAERFPELISRLVILNAPHYATLARELKTNPRQQEASAYMGLLASDSAEEKLHSNDYAWLRAAVFEGSRDPDQFDPVTRDRYKKAWSQPGALTGAVNYYRAFLAHRFADNEHSGLAMNESRRISAPTLVIWGEQDVALLPDILNGLEKYTADLTIKRIPKATHWVQHDFPCLVNRLIQEFIGNQEVKSCP